MKKRGFTLIEVTVVILILGILFSLSTPAFMRIRGLVRQNLMKDALRTMFKYEQLNYLEKGKYFPEDYEDWGYMYITPDNKYYPEEIKTENILFSFPKNTRYFYYVYWYKWGGLNMVSDESNSYIVIYAWASVWDGNDLDGDMEYDFWYVDNYQEEPYPIINDLANDGGWWY